jgi:hypothetical protein
MDIKKSGRSPEGMFVVVRSLSRTFLKRLLVSF